MTGLSRARVARRIAAGAAYGGGGIGLAGAAAVGLLLAEAQLARRRVGNGASGHVPNADGLYGASYTVPGEPALRLTMLGDSTAAGQGVHRAGQTPGALLASGVAAIAERPVGLSTVAVPGARSDDLERQVTLALADPSRVPDVCVIMIGANDVTHRMPPAHSVRHLSSAVRRLRTAGAEVVVGTCPDLGTIEPVRQPLRWLLASLLVSLTVVPVLSYWFLRADGVAGGPAGPRVRGEPAGAVRARQLPPLGGGVRHGRDGGAADGGRGAGAVAGGGGAAGRRPPGGVPAGRQGGRGGGGGGGHGGHGGDAVRAPGPVGPPQATPPSQAPRTRTRPLDPAHV
ncbi:LOW QUALITY PROTEIN: secreted protein, partial [Streptomyces griseoflavus Tu4000]